MKIVWRRRAQTDLESMVASVSRESPAGAARMYEQVKHSVGFLADWPEMGRESRTRGVRELIVRRTPYIVLYRLEEGAIYVLRVIHGMRKR